MRRFVLWGARSWDVQIGGFVWRSLDEFRRRDWQPGKLRYPKAGW